MSTPHEPLTAEERDLAERLARLDGHREPAPALDAAILAAARAAVAPNTAVAEVAAAPATVDAPTPRPAVGEGNVVAMPPRKPRPRWPLGLSLAASLVLAAGIGWKLQFQADPAEEAPAVAAASAPQAAEAAADSVTEAVLIDPPMARVPPPPPPPLAEQTPMPVARPQAPAPARGDAAANAAVAMEADAASADMQGYVADEAIAAQAATAVAAAPPAPAAPPAFAPEPPADAAKRAAPALGAAADRDAEGTQRNGVISQRSEKPTSDALDKLEVTGSRVRRQEAAGGAGREAERRAAVPVEEHYDDQPPLSADSPEVRQAWLQRIRVLLAEGKTDTARESLQEFRRRYPKAELPEDLRKLAATLPPPPAP